MHGAVPTLSLYQHGLYKGHYPYISTRGLESALSCNSNKYKFDLELSCVAYK